MRCFVSLLALAAVAAIAPASARAQEAPAAAAAADAPAAPPVAVIPLPDAQLNPPIASAIRDAVAEAFRATVSGRSILVVNNPTVLAAFAACTDATCIGTELARGGVVAGVLVRMTRARPRDPIDVTIEVVDPVSGAPRAEPVRVVVPVESEGAPGALVAQAAAPLAATIPAPPQPTTLLLAINVDDAEVAIDGRQVGTSPLAPLDLPPGRHTISVSARGFAPWSRMVEVAPAESARVNVDLAPDAAALARLAEEDEARADASGGGGPWYTRWYVLAGAGAAAVLVGVIVVLAASGGGGDGGNAGYPVPPIR